VSFRPAIPRRVAPQQSPLPLRRPCPSTSAAHSGTIDSGAIIGSHPSNPSAVRATSRQLATAVHHRANLPRPNTKAGAGYCPKCQGATAQDWLAAREADLLPVGDFHMVFTLPAEIAPIAYQNKAVVYDLLFRTAAKTLLTIAADPKHLGARIGATAVLHSWARQ
jgi:hypothetical protein